VRIEGFMNAQHNKVVVDALVALGKKAEHVTLLKNQQRFPNGKRCFKLPTHNYRVMLPMLHCPSQGGAGC
jgi:hypothetical protein